jgi:hypothetical protein
MRKPLGASKSAQTRSFVDFKVDKITYQIDTQRRKVYRRFIEVETSRASQIMADFGGVAALKG